MKIHLSGLVFDNFIPLDLSKNLTFLGYQEVRSTETIWTRYEPPGTVL